MNTMYAQVSARTREIGTLRAIGFSRRSILLSFVIEALMLCLAGGLLGVVFTFLVFNLFLTQPTGTMNFRTFSEVLFNFRMTPAADRGRPRLRPRDGHPRRLLPGGARRAAEDHDGAAGSLSGAARGRAALAFLRLRLSLGAAEPSPRRAGRGRRLLRRRHRQLARGDARGPARAGAPPAALWTLAFGDAAILAAA